MSTQQPTHQHLANNAFINQLQTALIVINNDGKVITINQAAEGLLLVSLQQVLHQPLLNFCTLETTFMAQLQECITTQVSFTGRDLNLQTHAKTNHLIDITVTPSNHDATLILEIHSSDRIKRLSRVKHMQVQRTSSHQLVRNLAHEIKNPLSGIRGAAQLLEHEFTRNLASSNEQKQLQEYTQVIISEADRLKDLVNRLLGPQKPTIKQRHNIHQVLDKTIALLAAETNNQVRLIKNYDPSLPELLIDTHQIMQVLLNIGNNALQELQENTNTNPQIAFTTRVARRFTINNVCHRLVCCISISDNGRGIDPTLIDNIFFPMVTHRAQGTGLGLSIAQTIVTQHEGVIECESSAGQTCFNIYLPMET